MEIVFATNNPNKLKELKGLVPSHFKILSLKDAKICEKNTEEKLLIMI